MAGILGLAIILLIAGSVAYCFWQMAIEFCQATNGARVVMILITCAFAAFIYFAINERQGGNCSDDHNCTFYPYEKIGRR